MDSNRKTFIRYFIPGGVSLVSPISWMAEKYFSDLFGDWWSQIPWGWLTLVSASFVAGNLLADWMNKNSLLRQKYEHWQRIFDVDQIWTPSLVIEDASYIGAKVRLRLAKSVQNAAILVQVFTNLTNGTPNGRLSWVVEKNATLISGEEREICLAVIPRTPGQHYSGWGDGPNHHGHVIHGSENLVSIEVEAGKRRQTFKLRLDVPSQNSGALGLFTLRSEYDDPFEIKEID
jgi:hypothetical protein